jgi:hypothetical protein
MYRVLIGPISISPAFTRKQNTTNSFLPETSSPTAR